MEYTQDLILHVRYDEVNNTLNVGKKKWTRRIREKIKKHKFITTSILIAITLGIIDGILIINFIKIFEML